MAIVVIKCITKKRHKKPPAVNEEKKDATNMQRRNKEKEKKKCEREREKKRAVLIFYFNFFCIIFIHTSFDLQLYSILFFQNIVQNLLGAFLPLQNNKNDHIVMIKM